MSQDVDEKKQHSKSTIMQWILCLLFVFLCVRNYFLPFGYFCLAAAVVINPWLANKIANRGVEVPIIARIVIVLILLMIGLLLSPSVLDLSAYYTDEQLEEMEQEIYPEEIYGTPSPEPSATPAVEATIEATIEATLSASASAAAGG